MKHGAHIIETGNGTSYRCGPCGQVCAYVKGSKETLGAFTKRVHVFIKKHDAECGTK